MTFIENRRKQANFLVCVSREGVHRYQHEWLLLRDSRRNQTGS